MAKLSTILDQIDAGTVLLPEFQRGYVWNRDQVRGLMRSLYRGHPVGGLLLWETPGRSMSVRGAMAGSGTHLLLLDGQQRVTTLYGLIRGHAPTFFEGDAKAFTGLRFNVDSEAFEFYAQNKMAGDSLWIDVTELFKSGPVPFLTKFADAPERANTYLDRLNKLWQIREREFHQEKITGTDKSVDEVVEIFNRVNSGGTKLSKGDLALAKLCAQWTEARVAMRDMLAGWKEAGFNFTLDWLLRNATAVATGRSKFEALDRLPAEEFQHALGQSGTYVGTFLDAVSGRLGLDHNRVLMGRYAFPVVSRLLSAEGGQFKDQSHRDKVLFWYVHSAVWGRFAGSTETVLQQDYDIARELGIAGLIETLERWRGGNLDLQPRDFDGSTMGSRFYPLLYMLTRVSGAKDFGSGLELKAEMLGKLTSLQVHHIFPKALLYKAGYHRSVVNAIANFCFLTQQTNLVVGMREPAEYFTEVEAKHPGALESQWIPTDRELWKVENYERFLAARRELLAQAAQAFLTELRLGAAKSKPVQLEPLGAASGAEVDDARATQVEQLIDEVLRMGLVEPALDAEIADPENGRVLAMAEAFWPDGLQPGQGDPIVLELDPEAADLPRLEELGYEVFTSADALLGYANRRNELAAGEPEPEPEPEPQESALTRATLAERDATEAAFARAMRGIYDRARAEANYTATYFLGMLADIGPLATARKLLNAPAISDGFAALWERGRLDLTVEALVLKPEFESLFNEGEREAARSRLDQFGHGRS